MPTVDYTLIRAAEKITTGANVHRIRGLICAYTMNIKHKRKDCIKAAENARRKLLVLMEGTK